MRQKIRRQALGLMIVLLVNAGCDGNQTAASVAMVQATLQEPVSYKVPYPGRQDLESWYARIEFPPEAAQWLVTSLDIRLLSNGIVVKTTRINNPFKTYAVDTTNTETITIPLHFNEPRSLEVNQVEVAYSYKLGGKESVASLAFPVETYQLRNSYIFPLKGNALLTNGFYNSGGHLRPSTKFAIDILGVDQKFGMLSDPGDKSHAGMTGWGRAILAPADGTVVFVERGIPDQPYDSYNEKSYITSDGRAAIWGNAVVIDHGKDEFSVLLHMKKDSVLVSIGEEVMQGQTIGALGNSGQSFGPHLHFHLQNGPELLQNSGLPLQFEDIDIQFFRKGEWIHREH